MTDVTIGDRFGGHDLGKAVRQAKEDEKKGKEPNSQEDVVSSKSRDSTLDRHYRDLHRIQFNKRDNGLTYADSLKQLRGNGWERHLTPSEQFSLICHGQEGFLGQRNKDICIDMISTIAEWLSAGVTVEGQHLTVYQHPGTASLYSASFDLKDLTGRQVIGIDELSKNHDDLIELLWSRPFDKLPKTIREKANLNLPTDTNQITPLFRCMFDIYGHNELAYARGCTK